MTKAAAVLAWLPGLGFRLPCVYAIWYLADRGSVWTFLGFPTYGYGPFEDAGIQTTVPLLPVEFAFWIGFALPLGPPECWAGLSPHSCALQSKCFHVR